MCRPASSNQRVDPDSSSAAFSPCSTSRSSPVDDGEATPADRPMPRDIKPSAVDMLHEEFAREKASALGRLGRALEAALDALARFDAGERRDTSPADARQLRATLVAEASAA